jgi:hypothetical protein
VLYVVASDCRPQSCTDELFLQAEGWELFEGAEEGSGANTEMDFELLDIGDASDHSSESNYGADDADLLLRKKQRQRAYQPPEPTQVCPAKSPSGSALSCHAAGMAHSCAVEELHG